MSLANQKAKKKKNLFMLLLLLSIKTEKQDKKDCITAFHSTFLKNIESVATEVRGTNKTVLHLAKTQIGTEDFVKLCLESNLVTLPDDEISLITVRNFYNDGRNEHSKNDLSDVIIAFQKYLSDKDRGFVHIKNLEVVFYTMKYDQIHDFDHIEKHLQLYDGMFKTINSKIDEKVLERILEMVKDEIYDYLKERIFHRTIFDVVKESDDIANEPGYKKRVIDNLIEDLKEHLKGEELIGIIHNQVLKNQFNRKTVKLLKKEARNIIEKHYSRFSIEKRLLVNIVKHRYFDKLVAYAKIYSRSLSEALSGSFLQPLRRELELACGHLIDSSLEYLKANQKLYKFRADYTLKLRLGEMMEQKKNKFKEMFYDINWDDVLKPIFNKMMETIRDEVNDGIYCKKMTKILFKGRLTEDNMDSICFTLNQTKAFDSNNDSQYIFIDIGKKTNLETIKQFDRIYFRMIQDKCDEKMVAEYRQRVMKVYCSDADNDNEYSHAKYTIGDYGYYKGFTDSALYLHGLRDGYNECTSTDFGTITDHSQFNLFGLPQCIGNSWISFTKSNCALPLTFCRITMNGGTILLITNTCTKLGTEKTLMLYNIQDLHLVSSNNQMFCPKSLDHNTKYIPILPPGFLESLNTFLHIFLLTNSCLDVRDVYTPSSNNFFSRTDVIDCSNKNPALDHCDTPKDITLKDLSDIVDNAIEQGLKIPKWAIGYQEFKLRRFLIHDVDYGKRYMEKELKELCPDVKMDVLEEINNTYLIKRRYNDELVHRSGLSAILMKTVIVLTPVTINKSTKAFFIIKPNFEEDFDLSISTIPLLALIKILNNPRNESLDKDIFSRHSTNEIRMETIVMREIITRKLYHERKRNLGSSDIEQKTFSTNSGCKGRIHNKEYEAQYRDALTTGAYERKLDEECLCEVIMCMKDGMKALESMLQVVSETRYEKTFEINTILLNEPTDEEAHYIENMKKLILAGINQARSC